MGLNIARKFFFSVLRGWCLGPAFGGGNNVPAKDTRWRQRNLPFLSSPLCSCLSRMAANVLQSIDFHPRTVTHAPSPFGFGFGLGPTSSHMAAPSWQSPAPSHSSACQQAIYSSSSSGQSPASRAQKRRHEPEEESENIKYPTGRDESMDRSPTPERPRRIVPKRARLLAVPDGGLKDEKAVKQNKSSGSSDENDVDVGVLLGENNRFLLSSITNRDL